MIKKKYFYIFPPFLVGINFAILLLIGIISLRSNIMFLDYISISVGVIFTVIFVISLVATHKIKQTKMKPNDVDNLMIDGPYSIIRHPNYAGIICMNIAYLLFFRTLWLIPPICVFSLLWYFEARYEEDVLLLKFGNEYKDYMKNTHMFVPKLVKKNSHKTN